MNRKEWREPNLLVLGLQDTKSTKNKGSYWECNCPENNKYYSIESAVDHFKEFWLSGKGTSHTTVYHDGVSGS